MTHIIKQISNFYLQAITYYSVDTVIDADEAAHFPTEFLNSVDIPGLPPHELELKIGVPIILLRNLRSPKLCNGTRLVVKQLLPNVIQAVIISGSSAIGESVLIPRIPLIPSDLPFEFKRLQFPVKVCFALTINKAQGQSSEVVGVHLESHCFSHGQAYVACSRARNVEQLFIYSEDGFTKNIVFPEVL